MGGIADFLVIGGGVAGLSVAARLVSHGTVVVLEAEHGLGYHASGRSATYSHLGIGNDVVRRLTNASRAFFDAPPEGFSDTPLARPVPALFIANEQMLPALDALEATMRRFSRDIERVDSPTLEALCPALRVGDDGAVRGCLDNAARKLDSDALLQGYARAIRAGGGEIVLDAAVSTLERAGSGWRVGTQAGVWSGAFVIDAAGAWADTVAEHAGIMPLGLTPLRRTIIALPAPAGWDARGWPFIKTATDEFYMLPEGNRILASPVDEVPSVPTDAQPEDYDVALAAYQVEKWTKLPVTTIPHRWAGLRTFTRDRIPTAGFAPDAPGFFWLAGQGGYGLQTAPAMALAAEAMLLGSAWPQMLTAQGLQPREIRPDRLFDRVGASPPG